MKTSIFPLNTLKEYPNDAEIISHQLMIKAGLIKRVTSGIYTWTPLGLRVLRKTEAIVREEMDRAGALELLMPSVQPAELWQESGRWGEFGAELLRFKDRHQKDYCLGPTHEEVITDFVRREIKSYKQLPVNFYQIQWKFRDEIRPRFGVMRSREFLMKDAYSFHVDAASLEATYQIMYRTYSAIFDRINLRYRAVLADSGAIGGDRSQEFHVLAEAGEDAIALSTESTYAANIERAETSAVGMRLAPTQTLEKIATPNAKTVEEVAKLLNIPNRKILKTLIVHGENNTLIALCLRGDHTLNETKASKINGVLEPLTFATDTEIIAAIQATPGSIGPINLPINVLFDHQVLVESDFACGANEEGFHFTGVNFIRDLPESISYDLRNIEEGDPSPCGKGVITMIRGIEVGHIFQLGNKYSKALNATVLDENGTQQAMQMGCYGIGVTRVVAAAIEQSHDDQGIIWPTSIAPFSVSIIPMNYHKSESVKKATDDLYNTLIKLGIEVLLEDRNIRAGNAFSDHELIGIPHRIVIGEKSLNEGKVEYKARTDSDALFIDLNEIILFIQGKIAINLSKSSK